MPHPWSDYQDWQGEVLRCDPHRLTPGDEPSGIVIRGQVESYAASIDEEMPEPAATMEELVVLGLSLAKRLAEEWSQGGVDRQDLESEAFYALTMAARSHSRKGYPARTFLAFAARKIGWRLDFFVGTYKFRLVKVPKRLLESVIRVMRSIEYLARRGIIRPTTPQIAGESLLSEDSVVEVLGLPAVVTLQREVERAEFIGGWRANGEPELVPIFGPQPGFTPRTSCDEIHSRGPIRQGSACCCMACHQSGMDHHPLLQRRRLTDPKPEPKPTAMPVTPGPASKETRREKRARLFPPEGNVTATTPIPSMTA